uniref:J domain-containing protein n=1 Tax=Triticum urartu TaxID=4572 RepID=A0A8R7TEP2_TRIUA
MDSSAGGGGVEPARSLEIAAKLLAARDLVGCKRFAEHAVDADPLLPGADELLAVADVHLAAQRLLPSGRPDPLAILQLQPNPDSADVKRAFRRLANLLAPRRNPHPGADTALRAVEEAFAHLSEGTSTGAAPAPAAPGGASAAEDTFWTVCPHCCHVHQYERLLVGRSLMCASAGCRRAFVATELPAAPPIVPGTDFYYCAWGFIPMGFPKPADLSTDWKPFFPMPRDSSAPQPASQPAPTDNFGPPRGKIKKTAARKKVGGGLKKHASGGVESGIEPSLLGPDWSENAETGHTENSRGININEVAKATDDSMMLHFGADGDIGFDLDVDASDDIMENLQNLPFLREDDNSRRMF